MRDGKSEDEIWERSQRCVKRNVTSVYSQSSSQVFQSN